MPTMELAIAGAETESLWRDPCGRHCMDTVSHLVPVLTSAHSPG
jgi:hypothetical protein